MREEAVGERSVGTFFAPSTCDARLQQMDQIVPRTRLVDRHGALASLDESTVVESPVGDG